MIKGINPKSENYKDTRKMLFSLNDICELAEPGFQQKRLTYDEFLTDPFGKKKEKPKLDPMDEDEEYKAMH
jgi:hypothetical protein